jgi:hypothetical protein|tara:strand:+ start:255 stop:533 length:279 start_codon:yes stop_codon:yes gene_type:complete
MASVFQIRNKDTGEFMKSSYWTQGFSPIRGKIWLQYAGPKAEIETIEETIEYWENARTDGHHGKNHPHHKVMITACGAVGNLEVVEFELVEK